MMKISADEVELYQSQKKAEMSLITFNFLLKDVNVSVSVTNVQ